MMPSKPRDIPTIPNPVDRDLRVDKTVALPQDPTPIRTVNIHLSREIAFDLVKMNEITAKVLGRLGCEGCHSGVILHYQTFEEFIVNPKTLEIEELGASFRG